MPLVAEHVVTLATPANRARVLDLALRYYTELRSHGSEILPTSRTLRTFAGYFDRYTAADGLLGAAIVTDGGFSMAGELAEVPIFDTDPALIAYGWGTYVDPEHRGRGVASALRDALRAELKRQGFQAISGAVHRLNATGADSLRSLPFRFHHAIGMELL